VKVVAYDADSNVAAEKEIHTAGKPYRIELEADRTIIKADGKDLSFITVKVVDKDGNLCPTAANEIVFKVKGAGSYCAGANGDPVSLESFQEPHMHVFSGMMTAIVSSSEEPGEIVLEASSKGLKKAVIVINTYKE
jgi:beta-galactosidase